MWHGLFNLNDAIVATIILAGMILILCGGATFIFIHFLLK
jgi:hypothetical protein